MSNKIFLVPGQKLPDEILEKLKQANEVKRKKNDYSNYLKTIADIFGLDPNDFQPNAENNNFLAGFLEGEGSINVSAKKHSGATFGLILDPEFSVTQQANGVSSLFYAMSLFRTGHLRLKSGSNSTLVYIVDNRKSIIEKVIPFYKEHILKSPIASPIKKKRLIIFEKIFNLFEEEAHKDKKRFVYELLPLWSQMRMQIGQTNQSFACLEDAQDYVIAFKKEKSDALRADA